MVTSNGQSQFIDLTTDLEYQNVRYLDSMFNKVIIRWLTDVRTDESMQGKVQRKTCKTPKM